ncbi:retrovirus-related pol polyprotein from transposon TNT 1-94 [Tanacetum coccineum]
MANQEQNPPQQEQPFTAAKQVGFNLEDILLNTNNKLAGFWYSAKALKNKVFFSIPTGGIFVEVGWFLTIGYEEEVSAKGTLKKSLLPPRWRLLMA